MSYPEDLDNARSRPSTRTGFFRRKLFLALIIVLFVIVIFSIWFFFISESNNVILPSNCYSINGEQICPTPSPEPSAAA